MSKATRLYVLDRLLSLLCDLELKNSRSIYSIYWKDEYAWDKYASRVMVNRMNR